MEQREVFLESIYSSLLSSDADTDHVLMYAFFKVFKRSGVIYQIAKKKKQVIVHRYMDHDMTPKEFDNLRDVEVPKGIEYVYNYEEKIIDEKDAYFLYPKGILIVTISYNRLLKSVSVVAEDKNSALEVLKASKIKWDLSNNIRNRCRYLVEGHSRIMGISLDFGDFKYDQSGYNKDLPEDKINDFINSNQEGLVLLYGKPGTGKSTFLKHLMNENKDVNFVLLDSAFLNDISNCDMLSYMDKNKGSVYIIEDCEKALLRREKGGQNVNTVLNLTNGILGSALRSKFICTFNTGLENLDKALLRKGRLYLKYEFTELEGGKTVSELYNSEENDYSKNSVKRIGF